MLHALEDPPHKTQADIARETGRSPAAISVLCRVGAALHPLTAAEREPLLTRHLTYTLLAHLVARHSGAESLRRAIVATAARPPLPTRRTRGGQSSSGTALWTRGADVGDPGRTPLDPLPSAASPAAFAYRFVGAEWQANAEAAFDEFAAFLRTTLDGVMRQAVRAIGAGDGPLRLTDPRPSTRRPDAPTARADAAAQELALRQLQTRVDALLKGHRAQLAAFEAEREARRAQRPGLLDRPSGGGTLTPLSDVDATEIEADLAE
jgi:hypothetical protein